MGEERERERKKWACIPKVCRPPPPPPLPPPPLPPSPPPPPPPLPWLSFSLFFPLPPIPPPAFSLLFLKFFSLTFPPPSLFSHPWTREKGHPFIPAPPLLRQRANMSVSVVLRAKWFFFAPPPKKKNHFLFQMFWRYSPPPTIFPLSQSLSLICDTPRFSCSQTGLCKKKCVTFPNSECWFSFGSFLHWRIF